MRLEDVTAEIRPRSDWEAVDLGIALARRSFWRLAWVWVLAMWPLALAAWWWRWHPWGWLCVWWWCKPAGARLVLHDLSRGLFGERVSAGELAKRAVWVWGERFWVWLGVARLSPRRPLVMPVADLEGLRGVALRERVRVVRRRGDGAVTGLSVASLFLQCWLGLACLGTLWLMVPEARTERWAEAMERWWEGEMVAPPVLLGWAVALCLGLAMSVVEIFATAAGFGLYLNNRSWIEGWDVELAFKRLAGRLRRGGCAVALVLIGVFGAGGDVARAEEMDGDVERAVLEEVLSSEDFRVYREVERLWEPGPDWRVDGLPGWLHGLRQGVGQVLLAVALVAAAGAAIWLLRRGRALFGGVAGRVATRPRRAGVVALGALEFSPDMLPDDPPATALDWWRQGRRREALALLYRAAIAWFVERRQLEIGLATTEQDCVRRVERDVECPEAEHFRRLTAAWIRVAYGGRDLAAEELSGLCESWPYGRKGAES